MTTLQNIGALAFVLLGVATAVRWARQRTPSTGFLALAIILLSFVTVAGRLAALLNLSSMAVTSVTLVAFMGSAYALLRYRDSLIPLSRTWHVVAMVATFGVTAAFVVSQALVAAKLIPISIETVVAFGLIGVWAALVKTRPAMRDDKRMAVSFNRGLWKCCTLHTVPRSRILNPMQNFLRSIDGFKDIEIFNADHFLTQQSIAYPIEQAFPVFLSDKHNREATDFSGLN